MIISAALVCNIIHSKTSITINSSYDLGMENQTNSIPQWRYPFIVVYKRLAYLRVMLDALFMKFNPPRWTKVWRLAVSCQQG
ncbi:MAG: hypothetical protein Q7V19_15145 [Bacteroidales bacterium]|nr:hypothetical protein [Bacteroidales bacterium]